MLTSSRANAEHREVRAWGRRTLTSRTLSEGIFQQAASSKLHQQKHHHWLLIYESRGCVRHNLHNVLQQRSRR